MSLPVSYGILNPMVNWPRGQFTMGFKIPYDTGTLFRNLQKCAGSVPHVVHNGPRSDLLYYNLIAAQPLNRQGASLSATWGCAV